MARGVPLPTIAWKLKGRPVQRRYLVPPMETAEAGSKVSQSVTVRNASKVHEGMYVCVASNNVGTVVQNSDVHVIRRTEVRITNDGGGRAEMTIAAGQKLKLPCKYSHDPMNR